MKQFQIPWNVLLILASTMQFLMRGKAFLFPDNTLVMTTTRIIQPVGCCFAKDMNSIHHEELLPNKDRKSPKTTTKTTISCVHMSNYKTNTTTKQQKWIPNKSNLEKYSLSKQQSNEQLLSSAPARENRKPDPGTAVNPEFMWRTTKSIDELEANMIQWWGTHLRQQGWGLKIIIIIFFSYFNDYQ